LLQTAPRHVVEQYKLSDVIQMLHGNIKH